MKRILCVGEEYRTIKDIMNGIFLWGWKGYFKCHYYLDPPENQYMVWCPKLAVSDNGMKRPGDNWYGWVNTMTDDGEYIYSQNYDNPERVDRPGRTAFHVTFTKFPKGQYVYSGVYVFKKTDPVLGKVYERVRGDLDISNLIGRND